MDIASRLVGRLQILASISAMLEDIVNGRGGRVMGRRIEVLRTCRLSWEDLSVREALVPYDI